jgi:hypothetical protein
MKNKMPVFVGVLITVLVFGLMFSGCKTEDEDVDIFDFEGVWKHYSLDLEFEFSGIEYTCNAYFRDYSFSGTFTATATEITLIRNDTGEEWTHKYTTDGTDVFFLEKDREIDPHFNGQFIRQSK